MTRRDRKLIRGLTAKQRETYVQAVDHYYARIYAFLHRLTRDSALAEDLTQEAFAAAWRDLHQFEGRSSFSTWLHQIALNVYRQNRRRDRFVVESLTEGEAEVYRDCEPASEDRLTAEDLQRKVQEALARLPEIYREVIILRVYQDLKYREVAEALRIPLGTAQYRLHIAFQKLREALQEEVQGDAKIIPENVVEG